VKNVMMLQAAKVVSRKIISLRMIAFAGAPQTLLRVKSLTIH